MGVFGVPMGGPGGPIMVPGTVLSSLSTNIGFDSTHLNLKRSRRLILRVQGPEKPSKIVNNQFPESKHMYMSMAHVPVVSTLPIHRPFDEHLVRFKQKKTDRQMVKA